MHPTSEMMSQCRKWHLREPKFAKFSGRACTKTPLESCAFGTRVSASGANTTFTGQVTASNIAGSGQTLPAMLQPECYSTLSYFTFQVRAGVN